ncbi:MAG: helix-turn-helix transcriptional regulator, partial [Planctomycetota bacterium]
MMFHAIEPKHPLDGLVETIFHLKDYCPEHGIERIVPDGSATIVIELDGQQRWIADTKTHEPVTYFQGQWLSGPHRDHFCISALQNTELLAIRFFPGGLFPLLNCSIDIFSDQVIDASELLDGAIRDLRSDLLQVESSEEKVRLAEKFLLQHCDRDSVQPDRIVAAVRKLQAEPTRANLSELVEASGYSRKQFIHLFRKHVGMRPKDFQRVMRFTDALRQIQSAEAVNWAAVSLDCGYSDQPHLIRDFRTFSGFTPKEL